MNILAAPLVDSRPQPPARDQIVRRGRAGLSAQTPYRDLTQTSNCHVDVASARAMYKSPDPIAFLIAVRQPDETDHTYAIIADTVDEAIRVVAAQEPNRPKPRHVGALGGHSVKRIKLVPGEARVI